MNDVKLPKLLSVGALISVLVFMPVTADAQRGSGRSHGGHDARSVSGSGVGVGGSVVRGTVVRPGVKSNVIVRQPVVRQPIVRQPVVAGSVSTGHFNGIGFGNFPVRTGFGTGPVRTGFEVGPVGTGFVHTRPVPDHFVNRSRRAIASKGFWGHHKGRFVGGAVVFGAPIYPYYPFYPSPYPYVYPEYGYPTVPEYYPPQSYEQPQTYGGDYGAGGITAGLSTYFMELGNQNQSGMTFDVWPPTTEVLVDGVYVGIVQDFSAGRALTVVPGMHRVDLQATGFRTATFDVALTAGQVVPYQGELQPLRPY